MASLLVLCFSGCSTRTKKPYALAKKPSLSTQQPSNNHTDIDQARLLQIPLAPSLQKNIQTYAGKVPSSHRFDYTSLLDLHEWCDYIQAEGERLGWQLYTRYHDERHACFVCQKPYKKIMMYARLEGEPKKGARTSIQDVVVVDVFVV
jgi:hypothetical protein